MTIIAEMIIGLVSAGLAIGVYMLLDGLGVFRHRRRKVRDARWEKEKK